MLPGADQGGSAARGDQKKTTGKTRVLRRQRAPCGCLPLRARLIKHLEAERVALVQPARVTLISVLKKRKLKLFEDICISIPV